MIILMSMIKQINNRLISMIIGKTWWIDETSYKGVELNFKDYFIFTGNPPAGYKMNKKAVLPTIPNNHKSEILFMGSRLDSHFSNIIGRSIK